MIFKEVVKNTVHMDEPRIWGKQGLNRVQKRLVKKEYEACDPQLAELEDIFLAEVLFGRTSYKEVYNNILEGYEVMCAWIEKNRKPKGININHEYFVHMYKPCEKEIPMGRSDYGYSVYKFLFALHKRIRNTNYIPGADMMIGITNFKKL